MTEMRFSWTAGADSFDSGAVFFVFSAFFILPVFFGLFFTIVFNKNFWILSGANNGLIDEFADAVIVAQGKIAARLRFVVHTRADF